MTLEKEISQLEEKSDGLKIRISYEERKLDRIKNERTIVADQVNLSDERQRSKNREIAELTKAVVVIHDGRIEQEGERDALRRDITFYEEKKDGLKSKILEVEDSILK